jgi:hypothetical protein
MLQGVLVMEYVLIIYIYAGALAQGDSVALTNIPMSDKVTCEKAANDKRENNRIEIILCKVVSQIYLKFGHFDNRY